MNQRDDSGSGAIAVTGASGFIGRRLLARAVAEGRPVVALSRRGSGVPGVREVVLRDYSDTSVLRSALHGVEAVIHLAARAHVEATSDDDAALFRAANVDSTLAVARACMDAHVRRVVLVSSIGVNGNRTSGRPFTEADVPRPVDPYAISKLQAERELASLLDGRPIEYVIVRPPLVYGSGCPGNFGRLVRLVAHAPWVPLGGLRAPRSFIHVDNLVDALLIAAAHPGLDRRIFLLSDGRDISVGEIVRCMAEVLRPGRRTVINVPAWLLATLALLTGRSQAFAKLAAPLQVDASAFARATGWQAPVDPLEGLRETARQSQAM